MVSANRSKFIHTACLAAAIFSFLGAATYQNSWVQANETVLYDFGPPNSGPAPQGPLVMDASGNLYGTTQGGGEYEQGAVFELSPGSNGEWVERNLYSFGGAKDGGLPYSGLVIDAQGNLYGTTVLGGNLGGVNCQVGGGCGTVFELSPIGDGSWQETVLYAFNGGRDGDGPQATVALDSRGNIYGTTVYGGTYGSYGYGTVFKLTPSANGWKETLIHVFSDGSDGGYPYGAVIVDNAGNVYGTAPGGGLPSCGCGVVLKFSQNPAGHWKETVLHSFTGGRDGAYPQSALTMDNNGNLYGTTFGGGLANACTPLGDGGCGVVFELSRVSSGWKESVLHAFAGTDGAEPSAGLALDAAGNLYGAADYGGLNKCQNYPYSGCGVVFELAPQANGHWQEKVLHAFSDADDGGYPVSAPNFDSAGNLYGVTLAGGPQSGACPQGCGVAYEFSGVGDH